ncbi:hypothetical protein BOS5A_200590 [Bosea sp. EC-HK365B]|nr:hypothetical protein BOSE21B_110538 [Bosea sp. 21B]CAD5279290.1 hypothetical protein BOSE7B_40677 [Bosea sp. 7B]VVT58447.1 hypothetical protein BOS5A_200590 [Bosea sp. EC-HK365B]VXC82722.1 hypothetical protein BOSE127_60075 [Bosea sp. 127]
MPCRDLFGALLPARILTSPNHAPASTALSGMLCPAERAWHVSSAPGAPTPWEDGVTPPAPMLSRGLGA